MDKKKSLLLILLGFIVLFVGATVLYNKLSEGAVPDQLQVQTQDSAENADTDGSTEPEKIAAPDFIAYDIDGNEVRLSDYIGKPIVLNFWASWCGPCKMEMPDFHEKYLEIGEDVTFLMVNMTSGRETLESASAFIEENEYTFPVLYDTASSAAMTYGVYSLPTTFFIDAQGYAVAQATGAIGADTLQRGIEMIQ